MIGIPMAVMMIFIDMMIFNIARGTPWGGAQSAQSKLNQCINQG
jgi:hypothetical protein